jgi:hypothetical protein
LQEKRPQLAHAALQYLGGCTSGGLLDRRRQSFLDAKVAGGEEALKVEEDEVDVVGIDVGDHPAGLDRL